MPSEDEGQILGKGGDAIGRQVEVTPGAVDEPRGDDSGFVLAQPIDVRGSVPLFGLVFLEGLFAGLALEGRRCEPVLLEERLDRRCPVDRSGSSKPRRGSCLGG